MAKEVFFKDKHLPFIECRYTTKSSKHYKPHMHSTFSIGAIDEAEVIYSVAGEEAKLSRGKLALINPNSLHHCNPLNEIKRSYYMLYIDTTWAFQVQQSLFNTKEFIPSNQVILEDEKLYADYIYVMDFFMQKDFLLEKEQLMVSFLQSLFLKLNLFAKHNNEKLSSHVKILKELMASNFEEDLTLDSIAKSLYVNPYTLLRNFKDEVGITPHAYRINCKIEFAKTLLQEESDISQVALKCGFFDQSHFHRYFKAITAVTPNEYRLNFLQ
jgi:AraC-like DNA-binding protein